LDPPNAASSPFLDGSARFVGQRDSDFRPPKATNWPFRPGGFRGLARSKIVDVGLRPPDPAGLSSPPQIGVT